MHYLRNITLLTCALLLGFGGMAPEAPAQDDIASVIEKMQTRDQEIKAIIDAHPDTTDTSFRTELKEIVNKDFDFLELSTRALGRYWREHTEAEQQEFVDVFSQIVRNSSVRKLDVYKADRIEYGEPVLRGSTLTVPTTVFKKDANKTIEYKMHQVDGQWRMYDLVIDEVSTYRNYRDAFYKEIKKNGWTSMLDKLKKRLAEDEEADTL
jgi:phospholipid transport system substrate-binding protein